MSVENNKLIKYKSKSAITLIALVITVIVLLILAGVAVSTLTGENGVITKAIEAAFRSEMAEMRDNVDLVLINCEMYGETVDEKFEQVKFEDAKKWDEYLKLEVIYYGEYDLDYGVTKLSRDYIKSYGDSILESNTEEQEGTKYVRNLYFVDTETAKGKEKLYIYDKRVDQIYKVPLTSIGPYKVHSVKELDYQKEHGTGERDAAQGTLITQESTIVKVGNTSYYGPELKGFVQEKTSALYYKTNTDGTLNEKAETLPITTYLSTKERTTVKNSIEYEFYNYEKQIWANIKVEGNGIDTYWTWIPRYAYKFEGNETKVIYIDTSNKQASNGEALPEGYIVHSAFIENNKKGIWASKYEVEQVITNSIAGDFPHYLPDMKGFNRENTYVEVMNDNGTFTETPLSKINNLAEFAKKNRWFDYDNQVWANIKTSAYGKDCWWVWIPRYAYRVGKPYTVAEEIQIKFVDLQDRPLTGEALPEGYIVHPAFEGGKKGIWVSKYEISRESDAALKNANFPDLSGFNPETTWIELYKDDGTFEEKKLSEISNIQEYANQHRWYDYSKQIWANIKTKVDGAECWWVWIPRYAYNLIDNDTRVIFIDENEKLEDGSSVPVNYIPHPGFEGKKGIWVSKYEVSQEN